jgi:hypothetical protein
MVPLMPKRGPLSSSAVSNSSVDVDAGIDDLSFLPALAARARLWVQGRDCRPWTSSELLVAFKIYTFAARGPGFIQRRLPWTNGVEVEHWILYKYR